MDRKSLPSVSRLAEMLSEGGGLRRLLREHHWHGADPSHYAAVLGHLAVSDASSLLPRASPCLAYHKFNKRSRA